MTDDPEGGQPPNQLSTPTRNRYFFGRLLTAEDLAQEQEYLATKRRLANRLLHGWGVVAGLDVTVTGRSTVTVSPGVALDGWGREIVVVTATTEPIPPDPGAGPVEVVVCYAEEEGEPVPVPGPDDAVVEATTVREVPRVEVRPARTAAAATDPVPGDWTELVRWVTRRPDVTVLPADPSVLLARLDLDADGEIDPDTVDIDVRAVIPGDALLLQVLRPPHGADRRPTSSA